MLIATVTETETKPASASGDKGPEVQKQPSTYSILVKVSEVSEDDPVAL